MNIEILRGFERIAAVIIGGGSLYLGFRLFKEIRSPKTGDGKITLPGNISIYVSRVGPGVFFAMFGTVILTMSFLRPVQTSRTDAQSGTGSTYSGFGDGGPKAEGRGGQGPSVEQARQAVLKDIPILNKFADELTMQQIQKEASRLTVAVEDRERILDLIDRAKAALMLSVWSPDWGDREVFRKWARHDPGYLNSEPPTDIARAAAIFKGAKP
jgi:hypothetical protein